MIWIKDENKYKGYVPVLRKSYSRDEINEMSFYNGFSGWSNLSRFVMDTLGIKYDIEYSMGQKPDLIEKQELEDIDFEFIFECFFINTPEIHNYKNQIIDVMSNTLFIQIKEYTDESFYEEYERISESGLLDKKLKNMLLQEIVAIKEKAERTSDNLIKVNSLFQSKNDDFLSHFIVTDKKYISYFEENRLLENRNMCKTRRK